MNQAEIKTYAASFPRPCGCYIYAYLTGCEPFYIGKGTGGRAFRHLNRPSYRDKRNTFFYNKLNKLLENNILPQILIIRDRLTEEQAYDIESDLIKLVGTRASGTGPLCNIHTQRRGRPSGGYTLAQGIKNGTVIEAWGELFPSLTTVSRDSRCQVSFETLRSRLKTGMLIEEAVKKDNNMNVKPVTCWETRFPSITAVVSDERCVVTADTFRERLKRGISLEDAAMLHRIPSSKPRQPRKPMRGISVTCWSQEFISYAALSRDPRCVVSQNLLGDRIKNGWGIERAATTPVDEVAARRRH